jgi:hypothetical protein
VCDFFLLGDELTEREGEKEEEQVQHITKGKEKE